MKTKKFKLAALVVAMLFAVGGFVGCNDKEDKTEKEYSYHVVKYTKCHEHFTKDGENDTQRLEYSLNGHDLTVTCYNETYNCCDSMLRIDVKIEDNKIIITELGDNLCNCICQRDAQYKITDIPRGHYTVEIVGWEEIFEIDVK